MRVAITGGSGFLGSELIRRLTHDGADRIVTLTRDEHRLAALQHTFGWHPGFRVQFGDVREIGSLIRGFRGCECIIHAAALKVVRSNPGEAAEMLATNILGTQNVIEAARQAGCAKLIFVSSDKAVHAEDQPYGISKAMAERLVVSANAETFARGLRLGCVRYGNVIGSTGSVSAKWIAQHAAGRPLTVSNREMSRFWITLRQAVDHVLAALANLRGGEIVVPNLPAAPITTLARAIAGEAAEFLAVADAPTETSGIRQGGEKVHEELLSAAEVRRAVRLNGSGRIIVPPYQHADMWDMKPWIGTPLPAETKYRSDVWPWKLSVEEMRALLDEA